MVRFVGDDKVAVFLLEDPSNIIYIKPKMDYGTRQKVTSAMINISAQVGKNLKTDARVGFDMGAYNIALLQYNVVAWEGPDFKGHPCTPENILAIDSEDPLLEKVLDEIAERNKSKEERELDAAEKAEAAREAGSPNPLPQPVAEEPLGPSA